MDLLRTILTVAGQPTADTPPLDSSVLAQSGKDFSELISEMHSRAPPLNLVNLEETDPKVGDQAKKILDQAQFYSVAISEPENFAPPTETEQETKKDVMFIDQFVALNISLMGALRTENSISNFSPMLQTSEPAPAEQNSSRTIRKQPDLETAPDVAFPGLHVKNPEQFFGLVRLSQEIPHRAETEAPITRRPVALEDTKEPDQEMANKIAKTEGAVFESLNRLQTIDKSVDPSTPIKIHVSDLATHFPVMVAATLPARGLQISETSLDRKDIPMQQSEQWSDPVPRQIDRIRVIRFQLEPAELGGLTVKMRVRDTSVEIVVEAKSDSTTKLLVHSREALSSAIEHKGMTLQTFDVKTHAETFSQGSALREGSVNSDNGSDARDNPDQGGFYSEERAQQEGRRDDRSRERSRRKDSRAHSDELFSDFIL